MKSRAAGKGRGLSLSLNISCKLQFCTLDMRTRLALPNVVLDLKMETRVESQITSSEAYFQKNER